MESDKRYRLLSLLVVVVYAAIQMIAINAPWFPADDAQELAFVRSFDHWWLVFGIDAFGLFRPIKNLLFLLFSVLEPMGMPVVRCLAILIGLITFFPVRAFFNRVFTDRKLALLATAIWMLSPTLVSSVAWLSCLNIQIMCGLAAGAIVLHDRNHQVFSALLLFLACVSYEMAVAIGPCIVVFDFFLRPERIRKPRSWFAYALYAGITLAFLVVRHFIGSVHSVNGSFANCSHGEIMFASAYFSCQHFLSWLWPFGRMVVFGGYASGSVSVVTLVAAWLIVLAAIVAALCLRRRYPVLAFGLAMTLVGFLPVSNITGVGNGPYGDYYLGIASLGLSAAVVALCAFRIGRPLVLLLRSVAVIAAFHWAWLWADGDRALFAAAENIPEFFGNRLFLVPHLADKGFWKEALQLGKDAESMVGTDSGQLFVVHIVRGLNELRNGGTATVALKEFELSRKTDDFGGPLRNRDFYIGCVYEDMLNDTAKAEQFYASALSGKWTIDSVPAADRLARLLAIRGECERAETLWMRALRMQPSNRGLAANLSALRNVMRKTERK